MDAVFFRLGRDGAIIACIVTQESDAGWCWQAWRSDGDQFAWAFYPSGPECDESVNVHVEAIIGNGWTLIDGPRTVVVPEPPPTDDDEAGDAWCRGLWTSVERG